MKFDFLASVAMVAILLGGLLILNQCSQARADLVPQPLTLNDFFVLAKPYCEDSFFPIDCQMEIANHCKNEQSKNPGHDPDFYIETAVENMDSEWWPIW